MPKVVKIVVAVLVGVLAVGAMAMLALRDASRRPEFCNSCHIVEPYYQSWAAGDLLAHAHEQAGISCQTCHPQRTMTVVHEVVTNWKEGDFVVITDEKVPKEACLSCHGDYATLAERTKNLDPNPHATHLGEEECYQCHKMHKPSPLLNYCLSCHHTGTYQKCTDCHEDQGGAQSGG